MPSPGGGMPSPGGSSGGSSGSGSPSPSGGSSDGGASGGSSGGAGDVGAIPPSPGQGGGGGGFEGDSGGGAEGGGDGNSGGGGEENPFGDADSSDSDSECGDTGALPGGIGGMGQEGECLSSEQPSASESDSESESSSSAADSGGGGGGGGGGSSGGATTGTGGAGSVGEFPEESSAERAERLGRELDESIGGFDETLGEEQREIAAAGRIVQGYDMGGGEGQGSGGIVSLGGQASSTDGPSGAGGLGGNTAPSDPLAGLTQQEVAELTPSDIPTMVDDDIIARQLREAAIVEKNPGLRDRLWDEYRKYKGLSVSD